MTESDLSHGTIHAIPADLRIAIISDMAIVTIWNSLTPLARNEWICWIESAKLPKTRTHRIERTQTELTEGIRRPCCWPGCNHRTKNGR